MELIEKKLNSNFPSAGSCETVKMSTDYDILMNKLTEMSEKLDTLSASLMKKQTKTRSKKTEKELGPPEPLGSDGEPKPKKTLSPEHLAKMQAGRKAAAERKKAAAAGDSAPAPAPAPAPAVPEKSNASPASTQFRPFQLNREKYLHDTETNGVWKLGPGNTKGDWVGILASNKKSIDRTASNPDESDGDGDDE